MQRGYVEPAFAAMPADARVQLRRVGYFWRDPVDSKPASLVLNRIATLRDGWAPAPVKEAPTSRPAAKPEPQVVHVAKEATLSGIESTLIASAVASGADGDVARSIVLNELRRGLGGPATELRIEGNELAQLVALLDSEVINRSAVRPVLEVLLEQPGHPKEIVAALGLAQVSDTDALGAAVDAVLAAHPDEVARYRAGEKKLTGFFMGQVMGSLSGKGDPKAISALLRGKLG